MQLKCVCASRKQMARSLHKRAVSGDARVARGVGCELYVKLSEVVRQMAHSAHSVMPHEVCNTTRARDCTGGLERRLRSLGGRTGDTGGHGRKGREQRSREAMSR